MSMIIGQKEMSDIVYLAESAGRRALKDLSPAERKVVAAVAAAWKRGDKQVTVAKLPGRGLDGITSTLTIAKNRRMAGDEVGRFPTGKVEQFIKGLGNLFGLRMSSAKLEKEVGKVSLKKAEITMTGKEIDKEIATHKDEIEKLKDLKRFNDDFTVRVCREMCDFLTLLPHDPSFAKKRIERKIAEIESDIEAVEQSEDPKKAAKLHLYKTEILPQLVQLYQFKIQTREEAEKSRAAQLEKIDKQHRQIEKSLFALPFEMNEKLTTLNMQKQALGSVEDFQLADWKNQRRTTRNSWNKTISTSEAIVSENLHTHEQAIEWLNRQQAQLSRRDLAGSFQVGFAQDRTRAMLDWLTKPSGTLDTSEQLKRIQEEMDSLIAASKDPHIVVLREHIGSPKKSRLSEYYNGMDRELERTMSALDPLEADRYHLLNQFRTHLEAIAAEPPGNRRMALAEKWRAELHSSVHSSQLAVLETIVKPAHEEISRWWEGAQKANKNEIKEKQRETEDKIDSLILGLIKTLKLTPNQTEMARKLSKALEIPDPDERYKSLEKLLADHPLELSQLRLLHTFRTQLRDLTAMDHDQKIGFIPKTQELWASNGRALQEQISDLQADLKDQRKKTKRR